MVGRHIVDVLVVADIAAKGHGFPTQAVLVAILVVVLHEGITKYAEGREAPHKDVSLVRRHGKQRSASHQHKQL